MKPLKPFTRIEQSLESVIEGTINRVFRPTIQPSEIARKLLREMSSKRLVSVNGAIVPNTFDVALSEQDFESLAGSEAIIADHLEQWLAGESDRLGFITLGEIEVHLRTSEDTRPRAVIITSTITEADDRPPVAPAPVGQTMPFFVQRPAVAQATWVIEVVSGPLTGIAHWIGKSETTVGRALDNDFVIDVANVSRHHARLDLSDRMLRVVDLGSLNGTFVNSRQVHDWSLVKTGDTLTFGLVDTTVFLDPP